MTTRRTNWDSVFFFQSEAIFIILVFCSPYPEPKKKTVVGKESRKKRSSGKVSINEYFWVTFPVWLREAVHNLVFKLPTETFPFLLFSSCSSRTYQSEEAFVLTKIFASSLIIRNTLARCIVVKLLVFTKGGKISLISKLCSNFL